MHDFILGMMSLRAKGASLAELVGDNLNTFARQFVFIFSGILLLLVGVVFVYSPADLLTSFTGINRWYFVAIIFAYYLVATVFPIDKIIGKIYPIFGLSLLLMAVGIIIGMLVNGQFQLIPEFDFTNPHIAGKSIFPYLCISIACGAISGFHATQSPMMARCMRSEKDGRKVFYGAMIAEGFVALIWAAASMTFFGSLENLANAGSAAVVVAKISEGLLGPAGAVLAILGVIACPITTGDTAFRALRLAIADALNFDQTKSINRYKIVLPVFVIAAALLFIDFNIMWRYFSWINQTLACVSLWAAASYLRQRDKNFYIALVPAFFMTVVVTSYILVAPEGFYSLMTSFMDLKQAENFGIGVGIILAIVSTAVFFNRIKVSPAYLETSYKKA